MVNSHKQHQQIASTLFRCAFQGSLCKCRVPCRDATKALEDAFRAAEKDPKQLELGDDQ